MSKEDRQGRICLGDRVVWIGHQRKWLMHGIVK